MRVAVAMSGGVDSSVAAAIMRDEGHEVFGVDKRQNTWTDAFRYLLQDLSGNLTGVEYPPVDLVVHLAAHAKVHQLVREPHRALENVVITFNVLELCRRLRVPIVLASSREQLDDIYRELTACKSVLMAL